MPQAQKAGQADGTHCAAEEDSPFVAPVQSSVVTVQPMERKNAANCSMT